MIFLRQYTWIFAVHLMYMHEEVEYFVSFNDDCSRYGYAYLMHRKSETFEKFKEFLGETKKQLDKPIKAL